MNSITRYGSGCSLDLVDLHDVLVPHLGRRPGLAQEPLAGRRRGGHLRGHHLDRDDPLQHVVERPEDDAEAAAGRAPAALRNARSGRASRAGVAGSGT